MASRLVSLLLSFTAIASAWMPLDNPDKDVFAFNTTVVPQPNGTNSSTRWLPASGKIRGVNLGSMFVVEPWMIGGEWDRMGCSGTPSEFDCVSRLGQSQADANFQSHWANWMTQDDIRTMAAYGLNTIRIPLGYWIVESLVDRNSERFPRGALQYLDRLVGWASDQGFYIILDLHGAPGAQVPYNSFTGQNAPSAGFYNSYNYDRAYGFLEFMTSRIHQNSNYRNVGMLEVVNEPISGQGSLVSEYYRNAYTRIRNRERALGVTENNFVHIQFMNTNWGAGRPSQNLPSTQFVAYDAHLYPKFNPNQERTQAGYLRTSCNERPNSDGDNPVLVGEWSISPADAVENSYDFEIGSGRNAAFYRKWWAAQVMAFERNAIGWIFWSWKVELNNDYRWGYKRAVEAGIIPKDPNQAYNQYAC